MIRRLPSLALASTLLLALPLLACSAQSGGNDSDGAGADNGNRDLEGTGAGNSNGPDFNFDGTGAGGGSTGSGGNGNICSEYVAQSEPKPPIVMILMDQSGSMAQSAGAASRWDTAEAALIETMASRGSSADFGFIGFPIQPVNINQASSTCNASLVAAPAVSSDAAIIAHLQSVTPNNGQGHTPTRTALKSAQAELNKPEYADRGKFVVLLTDGRPNCKGIDPSSSATSGFWQTDDPGDTAAELLADGITTFVIGFGINPSDTDGANTTLTADVVLTSMAESGGTETWRPVENGEQLNAELAAITASVAPCDFELSEPPAGGAEFVRVTIDGKDYALDDEWSLTGEQTISLHPTGDACGVLRDGETHEVKIQVECEPVVVR